VTPELLLDLVEADRSEMYLPCSILVFSLIVLS